MDLKETIDSALTARINQPTVRKVYEEWKSRGLLDETQLFLNGIHPRQSAPIIHSFITHVHKEKGLFVDVIGEELGFSKELRSSLATSADMLWALSLMVDDIEDHDHVRSGLPSCWVKFGKQQTQESVYAGLKALFEYLSLKTGSDLITRSCISYINISLTSIGEHRTMSITQPPGEILKNYERRCDFHGTFPLASLISQTDNPSIQHSLFQSIAGLRLFNQAGQLINDLKDFVGGDLYLRSFSDLKRKVPTIPLKTLHDSLSRRDQKRFEEIYGSGYINQETRIDLEDMVLTSRVVPQTILRIENTYEQSLGILSRQLSSTSIGWFQDWALYKINHLHEAAKVNR